MRVKWPAPLALPEQGAQKMTITALKQLFSLFSILKEFIMFKKLFSLSIILLTSMTFAQTNPLSVHVLNLENGLPSA